MSALDSVNKLIPVFNKNDDGEQESTETIDLTIFDQIVSKASNTANVNESLSIKRILTLLKYHQMLNVNTDKEDQNIFINFINTKYTVKDIIMDNYELQKKYGNQIQDIMNIAMDGYKIKVYDINTCPHSSRLYRVEDKTAELNIFNKEDKESIFKVVMDIIDGIYHFIFHIYECGLRVDKSDVSDADDLVIDDHKAMDEHYDLEYAQLSARISKTAKNTERFDRISTSNKFSIKIGENENDNTDVINDDNLNGITYLDSVYMNLTTAGIDESVIESLSNYILTELFDTEGLELDLQIEKRGNIEINIDDKTCIDYVKNMFQEAASYVFIFLYTLYISYAYNGNIFIDFI